LHFHNKPNLVYHFIAPTKKIITPVTCSAAQQF